MNTIDTGILLAAVGAITSAVLVVVRVFIRSVVSEEINKLRDHLDTSMTRHLSIDHGYGGTGRLGPRHKMTFRKEDDNEH